MIDSELPVKMESEPHDCGNTDSYNQCRCQIEYGSLITNPPKLFNCMDSLLELYKCDSCDYKTCLVMNLKEHHRMIHKPDTESKIDHRFMEMNHRCEYCNFETWSYLTFLRHNYGKCSINRHPAAQDMERFGCEHCPYKRNQKFNQRQRCFYKNTLESYLESSIATADVRYIKRFPCEQCSYKGTTQFNLEKHMARHEDQPCVNWFPCEQCSYKGTTQFNLKRHITGRHADQLWFPCEHCSYMGTTQSNLKGHIAAKHKPRKYIKLFECEHCSYKGKLRGSLDKHVLVKHKLFKLTLLHCQQCSFTSKTHVEMKQHVLAKHTEWFECEHCSYKSQVKSVLDDHVSINHSTGKIRQLKCKLCSYRARWQYLLEGHVLARHPDSK